MYELSQPLFDVYALSLPRGHGFGSRPPIEAWGTVDGLSCGVVTRDEIDQCLGIMIMRRRIDSVWIVTATDHGFRSIGEARARVEQFLREGDSPEPIPSSVARRLALHDLQGRTPSDAFKILTMPSHHPAAWMLNQLYLALPRPDKNWAGDCQTGNFHTRIWEAQLLASFREQGLFVEQPFESPDFRIENREGGEGWVEAVTANPKLSYNHVNAPPSEPPTAREERFFGPAAVRFAKTLGNKLTRDYHKLAHVAGKPFMIAIADFQAPASMVWSREALVGYLYGLGAKVGVVDGKRVAVPMKASHLLGQSEFPAGLFTDGRNVELSAVIFSNACSIAKLNRVAVSGGGSPKELRYMRIGGFFDRTPGALKAIPFCLDITSVEYRSLWPHNYEPWSAELEVFHNPFALHPAPVDLVPEATHWTVQEDGLACSSVYEHSILWSQTLILNESDPVPSFEDLLPRNALEP